jgi:phage shock protein PspC (stress-responsive transcriptional regulator)
MNEVTRIHLGRQPFTISVEAHKLLKEYLANIQKQVGDKEVADEVELRMSELLTERGITADKVILPADVDFLKEQLGNPDDFSDSEDTDEERSTEERATKRLFRDTENGVVAGVSSGLANYIGIDAVLIRVLFIVLTLFGGGLGAILYIMFWLVVPAAETTSEKLQMRGKPVTLEALKKSVDQADVAGAARRANNVAMSGINRVFRACVKLAGVGFILAGVGVIVGVVFTKMYMLLHDGRLFQENLFPVGIREEWLVTTMMIGAIITSVFLFLMGVAAFKRKWPVRGWVTGILAGLLLLSFTTSMALTADTVPRVQERYETTLRTTAVKDIQPFNKIVTNGNVDIAYISSPEYAVNIRYSDHPDLSKVSVKVQDGTLYIDSRQLDEEPSHCTMLCLFPNYNMTVRVYAPSIDDIMNSQGSEVTYPDPVVLN